MRKSAAPSTRAEKNLGQGLFLTENAQERTAKPKTPGASFLSIVTLPRWRAEFFGCPKGV